MLRLLPVILYVALSVYCIADAVQRPEPEPYGLPRWAWVLIIIFFPFIGAGVWLYFKFTRPDGGGRQQPPEPRAPDDDPEYLAWLRDQAKRRRKSDEG